MNVLLLVAHSKTKFDDKWREGDSLNSITPSSFNTSATCLKEMEAYGGGSTPSYLIPITASTCVENVREGTSCLFYLHSGVYIIPPFHAIRLVGIEIHRPSNVPMETQTTNTLSYHRNAHTH